MAKTKKDLPAGKDVKGGGRKLCNDSFTIVRAATPTKKDLPAGKDVKGGAFPPKGGITNNDNLTLVRAR